MATAKLKIGIDARILRGNWVGVSRYLINYLQYLIQDSDKEIYLFSNAEIVLPEGIDRSRIHLVEDTVWKRVPGTVWVALRLNSLLKQYSVNVFWGVQQGIPLFRSGQIKYVATIHDVVHIKCPTSMQWPGLIFNRLMFPLVLAKADHLIFISNATKQDVLECYPKIAVDEQRSSVIYQIVHCAHEMDMPSRTDAGYLFTVGSLEPRKNLDRFLRIFAKLRLKLPDIRLKIAGGKSWGAVDLPTVCRELHISEAVDLLGGIDDDKREQLLSACTAYVFPSLYEGYGIPVLEAVNRAPVMASDIAVFRELSTHISGIHVIDFSEELDAVVNRLVALLSGPELPICKIRKESALRFSPDLSYRQVSEIFSRNQVRAR